MSHYIRFPTKQVMDKALTPYKNEEGIICSGEGYSIDVIGQITIPAKYNGEIIIEPAITLDGWHVNWLGDLPDNFVSYEVFPEHPVRIWA
ncbi:hypothetical protein LZD49_33505 [Dyadobacter sp. CY261]|uniref:hypothetical protein n=1 Tax=Dyadobacter sp. CY261 TaxID=2907203 RepID=UPI001F20743B|nr:hypothetical protein [Dyadobacter sp. CY261]MCF0075444.1 hypothetical protein [Dyadobacter sp. CY261]